MKYLIGVVLGLLLHKAASIGYEYSYLQNINAEECRLQPYPRDHDCAYKKMGGAYYLKYITMRPRSPNSFGNGWTY